MKKIPVFLTLLVLVVLGSCEKESLLQKEAIAQVQTLEIQILSSDNAVLKGNVLSKGKVPVLEYGFVHGFTDDISYARGTKEILSGEVQEGPFSKQIDNLFAVAYPYNPKLYARTFIKTEKGILYGEVKTADMPPVVAESIHPVSGKSGDLITIKGRSFPGDVRLAEVTFSGVRAKVVSISSTQLVVEVPERITHNLLGMHAEVVLKLGGLTETLTKQFIVIPTITGFSPSEASVGAIVHFTGVNLPNPNNGNNRIVVYFDGLEGQLNSQDYQQFQARVPPGLTNIKPVISVKMVGRLYVVPGEFSIMPPIVTAVSPATGLPGSIFKIQGSGFSPYTRAEYQVVRFGDNPAEITLNNYQEVYVQVPAGSPVGLYKVALQYGPHTVEAAQQFEVILPKVTGFHPAAGGAGQEIKIEGLFLPWHQYQVHFGTVITAAQANSATTLAVAVPNGLPPGIVKLQVKDGAHTLLEHTDFIVLAPAITSFTPASGVAGTPVTISVEGFTPTSTTKVQLGGTETIVVGYTHNTIQVLVPSNLSPGALPFRVLQHNQLITSTSSFTVIN